MVAGEGRPFRYTKVGTLLFEETPKEYRESVCACDEVCEVCASVGVRGGRE